MLSVSVLSAHMLEAYLFLVSLETHVVRSKGNNVNQIFVYTFLKLEVTFSVVPIIL